MLVELLADLDSDASTTVFYDESARGLPADDHTRGRVSCPTHPRAVQVVGAHGTSFRS